MLLCNQTELELLDICYKKKIVKKKISVVKILKNIKKRFFASVDWIGFGLENGPISLTLVR